jgi:Fe-Mn family superoxide dismutase
MKTSRRSFLEQTAKVTVLGSLIPSVLSPVNAHAQHASPEGGLQFSQVKLPYAYNALEPNIDATTMEIHYSKHHATYIKNVNEAIAAEKISFKDEKEFFSNTSKLSSKARNNGGGAWNHNFFWQVK